MSPPTFGPPSSLRSRRLRGKVTGPPSTDGPVSLEEAAGRRSVLAADLETVEIADDGHAREDRRRLFQDLLLPVAA